MQLVREWSFRPFWIVWMLVVASALLAPQRGACASEEESPRSAFVAAVGGWRIFNSQLGLRDDAMAGLRTGLGVGSRVFLITDYTASGAERKIGSGTATVHALRTLVRVDVLTGRTRPYIVTGAGGLLFDFNDAQDYATGALTMGYGIEQRFAGRARITLEGDLDFYRNRTVVYSSTGQELSTSRRATQGLGTIALGLGFAF